MTDEEYKQAVQEIQAIRAKRPRLYLDEMENIKQDLLTFIHEVTQGNLNTPEQVNALCEVVGLVFKYY